VSRVLFASTPAWGHVLPVLAGLAELGRRGHRVRALASPSFAAEIATAAEPVPYDSPMDAPGDVDLSDMTRVLPMMLGELRASYAALDAAVRAERPDVVVADVLAMSGWALAEAHGLPLVRTWPVFASNSEFSLHEDYGSRRDTDAGRAEFFGGLAEFLGGVGLDPTAPQAAFDNVADRNIALYPRELQPRGETFDERFTFVTPCIRAAEESADAGWLRSADPLAVVSLGTVFNERLDFFRTCLEAVAGIGWAAAAALGDRVRPEDVGTASDRVLLRPRLPMIDALRHASVLVSHGGLTSTIEALAHGVPVVIAPQIGEQEAVADSVVRLGLGARLTEPFTADELVAVIRSVVEDPGTAERVARFRGRLTGGQRGSGFADAVERALLPGPLGAAARA
jgi:MGT family glycosyltransferase